MNKNFINKIVLGLLFAASIIGCASTKPMYYWGNYSDSLYDTKKNPGAETIAKHKEVLENIVEESKNRNLRIPPGVCAELGYLYAAQNNNKKAIELFQMEKMTYPESTILMDRLIQQSEKRSTDNVYSEPTSVGEAIKREKSVGEKTK